MKKYDKDIINTTFQMAWPAIVESFFVAFAGLVDSYMVSSMGSTAVASIGLTTQPKFMGFSLFFALNVAVSALVARRRGEQKQRDANGILCTAVLFVIIASAIMSTVLVLGADKIIAFCGSTEDTHAGAVLYYQIIMGGMFFNCLQMCINAAQRGAGNTKITMRTNVTSNTINVIGNYLLIGGHFGFPALGIKGAAIATVFGTVVAAVMSVISIMKSSGFISIPYIIREKTRPAVSAFVSLIQVGYSVFFEQILTRIGFMLTAIMAANQGTDAMAAHQVGMNIMGLTFSFGDGLQASAVALIGRSLGARDEKLAKEYGRTCQLFGRVIAVVLVVVYFFGAGPMMRLFFQEEHIVAIGIRIMRVILFVVVFQIISVIYMGCLRGAGDTRYTAMASMVSVTITRSIGSYFFGYIMNWGIMGIWLGVLCDQISRYLFSSIRYRAGKWTKIKI